MEAKQSKAKLSQNSRSTDGASSDSCSGSGSGWLVGWLVIFGSRRGVPLLGSRDRVIYICMHLCMCMCVCACVCVCIEPLLFSQRYSIFNSKIRGEGKRGREKGGGRGAPVFRTAQKIDDNSKIKNHESHNHSNRKNVQKI